MLALVLLNGLHGRNLHGRLRNLTFTALFGDNDVAL